MRFSPLILLCLVLPYSHYGQTDTIPRDSLKFIVHFTDKNNSSYSLSNPTAYLSNKALERRDKYNIAIQENDLPVNPPYINMVLSVGKSTLLNKSKWLNAISIYSSDSLAIKNILALDFVKSVDTAQKIPLYKYNSKFETPTAELELEQEKSSSAALDYGLSFNQNNSIAINYLHSRGYKGKGICIAVLDAGFYKTEALEAFAHLRNNNQLLGTWNFLTGNSNVFQKHTHGTNVLSTMAAYLPNNLIGTAIDANYWLLVSEDGSSEHLIEEFNWAVAAEYADSVGADIINSSLGYNTFNDPSLNHTYADMDGNTTMVTLAADIAANKGILVVNSAGNEGNSSWKYILAPADGDSVLAVGAIDANGNYASFSSIGPSSDGRVKPNVVAQGSECIVANTSGSTSKVSGTSFASPIIAGSAACLWQAFPEKSNMDILNAIQESANQYTHPDSKLGYGIPNFFIAYQLLLYGDHTPNKLLDVSPNPFQEQLHFFFASAIMQTITIKMFDMLGRKVFYEEKLLDIGYHEIGLDLRSLSNHTIYVLVVNTADEQFMQKVINYD